MTAIYAPPHFTTQNLSCIPSIRHGFFGRAGGVSKGIYASLNCGAGSDDDPAHIIENQRRCTAALQASNLYINHQTHSADCIYVDTPTMTRQNADAIVTQCPNLAIGVLTADCMSVLLCDPSVPIIGAAHAGWRGALAGILEATIKTMCAHGATPDHIIAGFGPSLRQPNFEVGLDVVDAFAHQHAHSAPFFAPAPCNNKRLFDLVGFGSACLVSAGVQPTHIEIVPGCTRAQPDRFFSYRASRQRAHPDYGRHLSAIALANLTTFVGPHQISTRR